jgi:hypothetical protein
VEALAALVAGILALLRTSVAPEVCPGGWAWATSALGVVIGLLPTLGVVVVAMLRRRVGSRYGVGTSLLFGGIGVVTAGLLPLLAFAAAGEVFRTAAAGDPVAGLSRRELRDLGTTQCLFGPQDEYLGQLTVGNAFDPARPLIFGAAVVVLGMLPVLTAVFVAMQARLALRRGPRWPAKFFWLPILALALLTLAVPAGAAGHLWLGAAAGAFLGIPIALLVGVPSRDAVRRSLERPPPAQPPAAVPAPREPSRSARAERLAERFAARRPEPVVALDSVPSQRVGRPSGPPRPTLVAPVPAAAGPPRFELIRRLGTGGFGRVWLAHDAKLGHTVALKAANVPDAETEQRIQREARALAAVRHPNCIRIFDLVDAASDRGLAELGGLVIVMQYVEGPSLGELVRTRGTLDDIAAARVWAALAGALDAAHQRGVLHRDVKPGNVVIDPAGVAHLIDFGIARRTGDATMTIAGFVLGTPDFLAPEVAGGGKATPPSDAWQLAATVSFAMTGHPPRGGRPDAMSGLRAAAAGAPLTHLPPRTAHLQLLRAALDTEPGRRPPLATVQRALEAWLRRAGAAPTGSVTVAVDRS